ncbi:MAG: hypothetical protein GY941_11395 [Planctomycetes bacterium]|nr:hypothetical protein [Planctomycetota bacterium]
MNLTRTYDADSEALNLNDVKTHLNITSDSDDEPLNVFIAGIRHKTETYLGKTLITSTWEYKLDCFDEIIDLPMTPVATIESIYYIDDDGASQLFTDYQFDAGGRLKPSYGNEWPSTRDQFDAVTVTYTAGKTDVQPDIALAMLLWVGSCDISRENSIIGVSVTEIPEGARALLDPYRRIKL